MTSVAMFLMPYRKVSCSPKLFVVWFETEACFGSFEGTIRSDGS